MFCIKIRVLLKIFEMPQKMLGRTDSSKYWKTMMKKLNYFLPLYLAWRARRPNIHVKNTRDIFLCLQGSSLPRSLKTFLI